MVPNFTVTMGDGDEIVLELVKSFLGCGTVYSLASKASRFQLESPQLILSNLVPLLEKMHFNSVKQVY